MLNLEVLAKADIERKLSQTGAVAISRPCLKNTRIRRDCIDRIVKGKT